MRFVVAALGFLAGTSFAAECPSRADVAYGHAQGSVQSMLGSGLRADSKVTLQGAPSTGLTDSRLPMYLRGQAIGGQLEDQIDLEGDAELRQLGSSLKAQTISFDLVENAIEAAGGVRLYRDGELYTGPALTLKLGTMQGEMREVTYEIAAVNGRGSAERAEFLQPKSSKLSEATYTTCPADRPAWSLAVRSMLVDQIREVADTEGASLMWGGVPLVPLGDISFALSSRRRSGFLPPSYAVSSRLGLEITAPFYWNMAPNRDMTLYPSVIGRRGVQLGTEFRYLEPGYNGTAFVELLPNDRERGESRSLGQINHSHRLPGGLTLGLNATRVSDDDYFADFGGSLLVASQRTLPATLSLSGAASGWSWTGALQEYQLLKDPAAPVLAPYSWMPRVAASRTERAVGLAALHDDLLVDWSAGVEATRFAHPTLAEGTRLVATSSLSAPSYLGPVAVTPKLNLHATSYSHETDGSNTLTTQKYGVGATGSYVNNVGTGESYNRFVPTTSLDAQMVFERDTQWGSRDMVQTLEPRIFYVYTPYREQSDKPVFDSGVAGVSLAQLFSDNSLTGHDRVVDQDQLTAGVTSRFQDARTGEERLRGTIAQRFYFDEQRVTFPGQTARTDKESDILAEVGARLGASWRFDALAQYTRKLSLWQAGTASLRYDPKPGTTFSLSYRYTRNSLNSADLAFQTPIAPYWYAVGRYNVSLQKRTSTDTTQQPGLIEALAGVEYDGGCWVARAVVQRYVTGADRRTNAVFLQFELNGIARVGTDPLAELTRSIPNYRYINRLTPPPAKFENYQ